MSKPIMVLGESGSGKSASMRNMDPEATLLIQAIAKPLPFRSSEWTPFNAETKKGNIFVADQTADIMELMARTKRKVIVLDDYQYVMSNEYMRRAYETGYGKFTEIALHSWNVFTKAAQLAPDVRVYVLAHSIVSEQGVTRMKTIGKLLDEKITPEGMFTIVLKAQSRDGEYLFSTRTNGTDVVKTPMGMFDDDLIPNDLAVVDAAICNYYGITK